MIKDVYKGIPKDLQEQILWVDGEYRTNSLSHVFAPFDVVVEYHNLEVLGYDNVHYPSRYIKKIVEKRVNVEFPDYQDYEDSEQLEIAKNEICRIFLRKRDEYGLEIQHFKEMWNNDSDVLPWEALESYNPKTTMDMACEDMVFIPHGKIQDGKNEITFDEFYMSKYLVTFDDYEEFCTSENKKVPDDHGWGRGSRPVINVNFFEAIEYCNWKSIREGFDAVYDAVYDVSGQPSDLYPGIMLRGTTGYRLCSVFEWGYACQLGNTLENSKDSAWFGGCTKPVGSLPPNELGIYDMIGNVWEWCWDKFDYPMQYILPLGIERGILTQAICGLGFESDSGNLIREGIIAAGRYPFVGFRLILGDTRAICDKWENSNLFIK